MEKIAVSIILPVYNSEKFLMDALESTTRQGLNNIELLIVNDGSEDGSDKIIDDFVRSHHFATKISQSNQGVAAARNHALKLAKGEYLAFLDSDDELCDNAVKEMYEMAKSKDADMVVGVSLKVTDFETKPSKHTSALSEKEYISPDDTDMVFNFSLSNKLLRRSIVQDHSIRFEPLSFNEDGLFMYTFLSHCKTICGCQKNIFKYHYRMFIDNVSAIKSMNASKFDDFTHAFTSIEKIGENWSHQFQIKLKVRRVWSHLINDFYRALWRLDDATFEKVLSEINRIKMLLPLEEWKTVLTAARDLELFKGVRTKDEIAEDPLVSIIFPKGHKTEEFNLSLKSLYYQNCPNFQVLCDASYEDTIEETLKEMPNVHFDDLDSDDISSVFKMARGRFVILVDVPCLFHDDYIRTLARRMTFNGRTFSSARPNAFYEEELRPVTEIAAAFGKEADARKRKSEEDRNEFSALDKYLSNKMFHREKIQEAFEGKKVSIESLSQAAYKICPYIRYEDVNGVFFGSSPYEQKDHTEKTDSSIHIVSAEDSGIFDDRDKMLKVLENIDSEWIIFGMSGFEWPYESLTDLQSFIENSVEAPGSVVCRRIYEGDKSHKNDFIFKYGDRITDIFDQPRALVDSFCNTAVRREKLIKVIAGIDKSLFNEYSALYAYMMAEPKYGIADSVHVMIKDTSAAARTENTSKDRFTFDICSWLYRESVINFGRIIPFIQHAVLYHLKDSNVVDNRQMITLISRMNEATMQKSIYYSKEEKKKMAEDAFCNDDTDSEGNNSSTLNRKSSGSRVLHYVSNLITAGCFVFFNRLFGLFSKVKKNKVLFISDTRGVMGGNFAAVYDKLQDELFDKRIYLKADRRDWTSPGRWLRFVYDMTTSSRIILEDYFRYTSYFKVKSNQQICQLWHAAGAYKKFGYSRMNDGEGIRIHKGYKKYGKAITSAHAIVADYAEAFGISEDKVKATGTPRTDIFFDKEYIAEAKKRVYEKYPALGNKKVILFAPTYRGLRAEEADYDVDMLDLSLIHDQLGDDYVFVFKWHPAMYNNILRNKAYSANMEMYGDFYIDLSQEKDIEELMLVSDIMITDYSSVIFDYYLLDKPVIFFAYDIDEYADGRGWYYPIEEYMYGPLTRTDQELISAIKTQKRDDEARKRFGRKFMEACDGRSTEKTCRWIFGDIDK